MKLQELAKSYQQSSISCRQRIAELAAQVSDPEISETQRMLLRRRICILTGMARETRAISKYLATYYQEEQHEEDK